MQFVFQNLVFPFQFNEMRLNCHTKPPRLDETSDSIRRVKCTRAAESVDVFKKKRRLIFPRSSVTNREYGTRPNVRDPKSAIPCGALSQANFGSEKACA